MRGHESSGHNSKHDNVIKTAVIIGGSGILAVPGRAFVGKIPQNYNTKDLRSASHPAIDLKPSN